MENKEFEERLEFIKNYPDVVPLLKKLGFRKATLQENSNVESFAYSTYPKDMYGIEAFYNDILMISIRFSRSFDSYQYNLIGYGNYEPYTAERFEELITGWVKDAKEQLLAHLNKIEV